MDDQDCELKEQDFESKYQDFESGDQMGNDFEFDDKKILRILNSI